MSIEGIHGLIEITWCYYLLSIFIIISNSSREKLKNAYEEKVTITMLLLRK